MSNKFYELIYNNLNQIVITIMYKIDRWYVRSQKPKLFKEFVFLVIVLSAAILGDLADWFNKLSKNK